MLNHRVLLALRHVSRSPEVFRSFRTLPQWTTVLPAYLGLKSLPLPYDINTRSGRHFRLTEFYDLETLWQIYCRGVYVVDPNDRVIIDAGANIGFFTCFAASRAPRAIVHAIEPFPRTFDRLVQTVAANGLDDRVTCHCLALSSSNGVGTLTGSASASQMVRLNARAGEGPATRLSTLEALYESIPEDAIDLLKMDIEGSEYDVLLSTPPAVLHRIRRIDVEVHPCGSGRTPRDLGRHLQSSGFFLRAGNLDARYGILRFARTQSFSSGG